jgi:hypothetical protein
MDELFDCGFTLIDQFHGILLRGLCEQEVGLMRAMILKMGLISDITRDELLASVPIPCTADTSLPDLDLRHQYS